MHQKGKQPTSTCEPTPRLYISLATELVLLQDAKIRNQKAKCSTCHQGISRRSQKAEFVAKKWVEDECFVRVRFDGVVQTKFRNLCEQALEFTDEE